jgi:hypothetical protein
MRRDSRRQAWGDGEGEDQPTQQLDQNAEGIMQAEDMQQLNQNAEEIMVKIEAEQDQLALAQQLEQAVMEKDILAQGRKARIAHLLNDDVWHWYSFDDQAQMEIFLEHFGVPLGKVDELYQSVLGGMFSFANARHHTEDGHLHTSKADGIILLHKEATIHFVSKEGLRLVETSRWSASGLAEYKVRQLHIKVPSGEHASYEVLAQIDKLMHEHLTRGYNQSKDKCKLMRTETVRGPSEFPGLEKVVETYLYEVTLLDFPTDVIVTSEIVGNRQQRRKGLRIFWEWFTPDELECLLEDHQQLSESDRKLLDLLHDDKVSYSTKLLGTAPDSSQLLVQCQAVGPMGQEPPTICKLASVGEIEAEVTNAEAMKDHFGEAVLRLRAVEYSSDRGCAQFDPPHAICCKPQFYRTIYQEKLTSFQVQYATADDASILKTLNQLCESILAQALITSERAVVPGGNFYQYYSCEKHFGEMDWVPGVADASYKVPAVEGKYYTFPGIPPKLAEVIPELCLNPTKMPIPVACTKCNAKSAYRGFVQMHPPWRLEDGARDTYFFEVGDERSLLERPEDGDKDIRWTCHLKGTVSTAMRMFRDEMDKYSKGSEETCFLGTIHGDLHPQNILMDSAGVLWVLGYDTELCNTKQHVIRDVVQMMNLFLVEHVTIDSEEQLQRAINITDELASLTDLRCGVLRDSNELDLDGDPQLSRAYKIVQLLFHFVLVFSKEDERITPFHFALLELVLGSLRDGMDRSAFKRRWLLHAAIIYTLRITESSATLTFDSDSHHKEKKKKGAKKQSDFGQHTRQLNRFVFDIPSGKRLDIHDDCSHSRTFNVTQCIAAEPPKTQHCDTFVERTLSTADLHALLEEPSVRAGEVSNVRIDGMSFMCRTKVANDMVVKGSALRVPSDDVELVEPYEPKGKIDTIVCAAYEKDESKTLKLSDPQFTENDSAVAKDKQWVHFKLFGIDTIGQVVKRDTAVEIFRCTTPEQYEYPFRVSRPTAKITEPISESMERAAVPVKMDDCDQYVGINHRDLKELGVAYTITKLAPLRIAETEEDLVKLLVDLDVTSDVWKFKSWNPDMDPEQTIKVRRQASEKQYTLYELKKRATEEGAPEDNLFDADIKTIEYTKATQLERPLWARSWVVALYSRLMKETRYVQLLHVQFAESLHVLVVEPCSEYDAKMHKSIGNMKTVKLSEVCLHGNFTHVQHGGLLPPKFALKNVRQDLEGKSHVEAGYIRYDIKSTDKRNERAKEVQVAQLLFANFVVEHDGTSPATEPRLRVLECTRTDRQKDVGRPIMLSGPAYSGKTVVAQQLACLLVGGKKIPVLVDLGRFSRLMQEHRWTPYFGWQGTAKDANKNRRGEPTASLLYLYARKTYPPAHVKVIKAALEAQSVVAIVDNWEGTKPSMRNEIQSWVTTSLIYQCQVVLCMRHPMGEAKIFQGFQKIVIQPFSSLEQEDVLCKRLHRFKALEMQQRLTKLLHNTDKSIMQQPINLQRFANMHVLAQQGLYLDNIERRLGFLLNIISGERVDVMQQCYNGHNQETGEECEVVEQLLRWLNEPMKLNATVKFRMYGRSVEGALLRGGEGTASVRLARSEPTSATITTIVYKAPFVLDLPLDSWWHFKIFGQDVIAKVTPQEQKEEDVVPYEFSEMVPLVMDSDETYTNVLMALLQEDMAFEGMVAIRSEEEKPADGRRSSEGDGVEVIMRVPLFENEEELALILDGGTLVDKDLHPTDSEGDEGEEAQEGERRDEEPMAPMDVAAVTHEETDKAVAKTAVIPMDAEAGAEAGAEVGAAGAEAGAAGVAAAGAAAVEAVGAVGAAGAAGAADGLDEVDEDDEDEEDEDPYHLYHLRWNRMRMVYAGSMHLITPDEEEENPQLMDSAHVRLCTILLEHKYYRTRRKLRMIHSINTKANGDEVHAFTVLERLQSHPEELFIVLRQVRSLKKLDDIGIRGRVNGIKVPDIGSVTFEIDSYDFGHGDYCPEWQQTSLCVKDPLHVQALQVEAVLAHSTTDVRQLTLRVQTVHGIEHHQEQHQEEEEEAAEEEEEEKLRQERGEDAQKALIGHSGSAADDGHTLLAHRPLLLTGPMAGGKTTICRQLIQGVFHAREGTTSHGLVPLLVPVLQLCEVLKSLPPVRFNWQFESYDGILEAFLCKHYDRGTYNMLMFVLKAKKLIVIVDGLEQADEESRSAVEDWIVVSLIHECRVVVTTREGAYDMNKFRYFRTVSMRPQTHEQQQRVIAMRTGADNLLHDEVGLVLGTHVNYKEFGDHPMTLNLVISACISVTAQLPGRRYRQALSAMLRVPVYCESVNAVLRRWVHSEPQGLREWENQYGEGALFSHTLKILTELAFWSQMRRSKNLPKRKGRRSLRPGEVAVDLPPAVNSGVQHKCSFTSNNVRQVVKKTILGIQEERDVELAEKPKKLKAIERATSAKMRIWDELVPLIRCGGFPLLNWYTEMTQPDTNQEQPKSFDVFKFTDLMVQEVLTATKVYKGLRGRPSRARNLKQMICPEGVGQLVTEGVHLQLMQLVVEQLRPHGQFQEDDESTKARGRSRSGSAADGTTVDGVGASGSGTEADYTSSSEKIYTHLSNAVLGVTDEGYADVGGAKLSTAAVLAVGMLAVGNANLRHFNMADCGMDREGGQFLATLLKGDARSFEVLNFAKNEVLTRGALKPDFNGTKAHHYDRDFHGLKAMCEAMGKLPALTSLDLSASMIGLGPWANNDIAGVSSIAWMLQARTCHLQVLNLSNNFLEYGSSKGTEQLASALFGCPTLVKIDLSRNYIGKHGGADALAGAIGIGALESFNLQDNCLGVKGMEAIARSFLGKQHPLNEQYRKDPADGILRWSCCGNINEVCKCKRHICLNLRQLFIGNSDAVVYDPVERRSEQQALLAWLEVLLGGDLPVLQVLDLSVASGIDCEHHEALKEAAAARNITLVLGAGPDGETEGEAEAKEGEGGDEGEGAAKCKRKRHEDGASKAFAFLQRAKEKKCLELAPPAHHVSNAGAAHDKAAAMSRTQGSIQGGGVAAARGLLNRTI